jgi:hypothetical protein
VHVEDEHVGDGQTEQADAAFVRPPLALRLRQRSQVMALRASALRVTTSAPSVPSTSRTQTLGMSVQHIQTPAL